MSLRRFPCGRILQMTFAVLMRWFCGLWCRKKASAPVGTQRQRVSAARLVVSQHPRCVLNAAWLVRPSFALIRASALPSLLFVFVFTPLTQARACGAAANAAAVVCDLRTPMPIALPRRNIGNVLNLTSSLCFCDRAQQRRRSPEWPRLVLCKAATGH